MRPTHRIANGVQLDANVDHDPISRHQDKGLDFHPWAFPT
jgi:hypothetical protein